MRVSRSAMGSVIADILSPAYQLDFVTPGMSPLCAISRKQMRQIPNRRNTPRERPHTLQRVYARTANLGLRFAFSIKHCLAKKDLHASGRDWSPTQIKKLRRLML